MDDRRTEETKALLPFIRSDRRYDADYNTPEWQEYWAWLARQNEVNRANLGAYPDPNGGLEDE